MKLLFDQNLSFRLCKLLADIFPGSEHVGRRGLSEADDLEVWRDAEKNDFVLVSLDSDFADLALLRGPRPKVIWLRCGNRPTQEIADLLRKQHEAIQEFGRDDGPICYEIY